MEWRIGHDVRSRLDVDSTAARTSETHLNCPLVSLLPTWYVFESGSFAASSGFSVSRRKSKMQTVQTAQTGNWMQTMRHDVGSKHAKRDDEGMINMNK